ncbi:MAG: ATP-dependent zinc metalloprotease FtsH [Sphaerochaeta sp.]|uniref:ATP-dependent zinc metalloprotease FtsH n=1 Tax=Sphaerochaeta sp. TaxID=1972642 RepID=UPI0029788C40|nr:ATP-dependent zinc metalloprotease FtsH [uncultured Sphaerochaeta sp.]MDD3056675.1 ATP-dependent zinc metalloprotease FtsH [Sphaerochaeta sp.]MDD3928322.1 ATP-dependent zinc metalloprotease FtsH [Sphaerochaeta sp.]
MKLRKDSQDSGSDKGPDNQDSNQYWQGPPKDGKKPSFKPSNNPKNRFALIVFVTLAIMFAYMFFDSAGAAKDQVVPYTTFLAYVDSGQVVQVEIKEQSLIRFSLKNGITAQSRIPYFDENLLPSLKGKGIAVTGSVQEISFLQVILQLLPWIIFIGFTIMLYRQSSGLNGKMMSTLGKSKAKEYMETDTKTTFKDVAGQVEAKYELEEVVAFLKHPDHFTKVGAKIPRGVLLVGPPGTGKTLLAKAVAGESGVSFFHTSGSDFVEMFVGMGAARVRDLFEQARKHAPCILFIDELDAVGRTRGGGLGGGNDEREQTLNQILVEMDGFGTTTGVIVMAATNRPDVLDPALLRPGRFDRQVVVDLPDIQEREAILRIHCRKIKLEKDVDLKRLARGSAGTSGADLANLINEAALFAARKNKTTVSMADMEEARDKILLGVARKSRAMTDEEKLATAYHEAGHALLHYYLKHLDPLHKVTIIPHGRALGLTVSLPERDPYTKTRSMLHDWIKVCMGGYVAEQIIYGETTTGTSNDIKQATDLARRMVTEWGMSGLGFVNLADESEPLFLGREITQHKDYSEDTAKRIDQEIHTILDAAMEETKDLLTSHRQQLDLLTKELVEKETLDDAQIRILLGFEPLAMYGEEEAEPAVQAEQESGKTEEQPNEQGTT